ncbi:MAG TPA: AI-2E family transporter, partial [Desulfobacterales bacterium]|nr:AI-2E family transporter [Desulfobacterales bacterium]
SEPLLRRLLYALAIMAVIAFGFYTFSLLKTALAMATEVLAPFLAGLLLAYILAPAVVALQRRLGLGRIMGTMVLFLLVASAASLLLGILIPAVVTELIALFKLLKTTLPDLLKRLSQRAPFQVDDALVRSIQNYIQSLEISFEKLAGLLLPGLKTMATEGFETVGQATRGLFSGIGSVVGFFSFLIFVGIINFYLIVDWEKIGPLIRKMVPPQRRERFFEVLQKIDLAMGGFLRGQLTVSALVGSMFAAGLFGISLMGFPALRNYCLLIGTAAAIGGFIPYLGPIIGLTPAVLILLLTMGVDWSTKLLTLALLLALFSLIQAIEGFVLQPRIVGKGAGLHPLVVLFALILGAQFGIGGMIAAVPLASVVRVLILEFYWLPVERREAMLTAEAAGSREVPTTRSKEV